MTGRQLQHRLSLEQARFSDMLDQARQDLALKWITHSDEPLARIADRLGFSEQSAFNRAFRRWTGVTPGAYRQRESPMPL